VGTWHDPDLGRPIAAPLERCAELLGVDLATVRELAAGIEPYHRADGTEVWSLMQLERSSDRRRMAAAGAATSTVDEPKTPARRERNHLASLARWFQAGERILISGHGLVGPPP
jgi:hypothetical protein